MSDAGPGIRFPPPLIFLCLGLLGWTIERFSGRILPLVPDWLAWAAAAFLGAAGVGLVASALIRFREAQTPPEPWKPTAAITRKGIYGRTRNPMYLGMALMLAAVGAGLQSVGILIAVLPALLIVDRFVIRREEAYLLARFGEPYASYLTAVPRWL